MNTIEFNYEYPSFKHPSFPNLRQWLHQLAAFKNTEIIALNFVFCDDEYLLNINRQYLDHDTYTDIITFDYSENNENNKVPTLEGDIFLSIDRIRDNARYYNTSFQEEFIRVMVHGVLHLTGIKDKTENEAKIMREEERKAINLWTEMFPG